MVYLKKGRRKKGGGACRNWLILPLLTTDDDQNNIPAVLCDTPTIDFPKPKKSIDEVPKLDNQNNAVEKEIIKKKEEEKPYEKPSRFDPEFVKSLLPPGAYIPPKYYEENPIKDETIDYGSLPRTFTLNDGFWALFPFIRENPNNDYLLQNNLFFQYQFVIRDLSLPEVSCLFLLNTYWGW
uniref:Uncharacterized protein n=1 Tax=Panagrolaimus davidi TaxID=227884 RepID=A0A914R1Y7_9BILA